MRVVISVVLTLTLLGAFSLAGGLGATAIRPPQGHDGVVYAAPSGPSTTATEQSTKTIYAHNLTGSTPACLLPQWHFIITQLDDPSLAPSSITVNWSSPPGGSSNVPLSDTNNKIASYRVDAPAARAYPVSASATIYSSWDGTFVLSLVCPTTTTTTTTSTSTTTSTTPVTTTTTTSSTVSNTTNTTTASSTTSSPTTTTSSTVSGTTTTTNTTTAFTTSAATTAATTTTTVAAATTTSAPTPAVVDPPAVAEPEAPAPVVETIVAAVTTAEPAIAAPKPEGIAAATIAVPTTLPRTGETPLAPALAAGLGLLLSTLGATMRRLVR